MNNIKIKMALIASICSAIMLIILGSLSFVLNKDILIQDRQADEISKISSANTIFNTFITSKIDGFENWLKYINDETKNTQLSNEDLLNELSYKLKTLKTMGALSSFIGLPNGDVIISSPISDKENKFFDVIKKTSTFDAREKEWFKQAISKNELYVTPVYIDELTKNPCISIVKAIYKNNKLLAVFGIDIDLEDIKPSMESVGEKLVVMDSKQIPFISSEHIQEKTEEHNILFTESSKAGNMQIFEYQDMKGNNAIGVCNNVRNFYGTSYSICSSAELKMILKEADRGLIGQIIIVVILVLISVIFLYFLMSYYLSPLQTIQRGLNSFFDFINHKTKDSAMIDVKSNDELGAMAKTINENITKTK
ncbi:hypothetical protein CKA54_07565, partial [Campylobacter sp. P255]